VIIIEDHVEAVETVRRSHRKGASSARGRAAFDNRIFLCREALLADPTNLNALSADTYSVDPG